MLRTDTSQIKRALLCKFTTQMAHIQKKSQQGQGQSALWPCPPHMFATLCGGGGLHISPDNVTLSDILG